MNYQEVISNIFYATFPIIGVLLVYIFNKAVGALSDLEKSVEQLNIRIAVIVEKTDNHEKRIEKLEEKI